MGDKTYTVLSYDISKKILEYHCIEDKSGKDFYIPYDNPEIEPLQNGLLSMHDEFYGD